MTRRSSFIAIVISLLPFASLAATQKVDFDHASGTTVFHAVGRPSAIKINGTGAPPTGAVILSDGGQVSGDLVFDLSTLDTGISMRTRHMKEKYLEVGKYPKATLSITHVALPKEDLAKTDYSEDKVQFKGNLTLHGVTKPIEGLAHIERHGNESTVHAEFTVKITDYAIPVPTFAGITVADEVSLVIDAKSQQN